MVKTYLLALFAGSVITFQSCSDNEPYEAAELTIDPVYSQGTLSITPVLTYDGEETRTFHYGHSISRITEVRHEGEIIYEAEEEAVDVDQQTVFREGDDRAGYTVEIDAGPGMYTVEAEAAFAVLDEDEKASEEMYQHRLVQELEVQDGEALDEE
ncbi:hypothetical protein [Alkalicoccus urumqiensis]|uniref:Uncharacterized protein n=1 Tax=Alkalicoccus urumqiensis TaxID=1548213 RepID=A0A2P6MI16_ALKUR|nr:hypothetical protein [Alkalicoccus urumqiensis]PRO65926.1 hypothetical protein C6I21_06370 [Alkalicoccus urumqiensis]